MNVPHLTIYTDRLPEGVGGNARMFVICIRPKYKNDAGIFHHELEHVRQWWTLGLPVAVALAFVYPGLAILGAAAHPALYQFVRQYRQWCEARAYLVQTRCPDGMGLWLSLERAARKLANPRYRLNLTEGQALAVLQRLDKN